jgi:hypothetical protein
MTGDILGGGHRELNELLHQNHSFWAAQRAESPSKKNATTVGLCDLRFQAILKTRMAHNPDDVWRLYVGPNMEGFEMLRTF